MWSTVIQTLREHERHMARLQRPRKPKPSRQADPRKTTSTRITPEIRERLERTAAQSGRSLAQEIELRLDRSFASDDAQVTSFGGELNYKVAKAMFAEADALSSIKGQPWLSDATTFDEVFACWILFLNQLRPKEIATTGPGAGSKWDLPGYLKIHGAKAAGVLRQLADEIEGRDAQSLRAELSEKLGELAK